MPQGYGYDPVMFQRLLELARNRVETNVDAAQSHASHAATGQYPGSALRDMAMMSVGLGAPIRRNNESFRPIMERHQPAPMQFDAQSRQVPLPQPTAMQQSGSGPAHAASLRGGLAAGAEQAIPSGQPFTGPDGKRYFRSYSGQVYPLE